MILEAGVASIYIYIYIYSRVHCAVEYFFAGPRGFCFLATAKPRDSYIHVVAVALRPMEASCHGSFLFVLQERQIHGILFGTMSCDCVR